MLTRSLIARRAWRFPATRLRGNHTSTPVPLGQLTTSRAAQQWVQALNTAPCFMCGHAGSHRVDCQVSGFPLTCSPECGSAATLQRSQEIEIFRQIYDDMAYTTSTDARTLLTTVISREQRKRRRQGFPVVGAAAPTSWEDFARLFTDDAQWLGDACAIRLLSAAYTFVGTLSSHLPSLVPLEAPGKHVVLHIVGARAEAMMPRYVWDELIDSFEDTTFDIKLIGDHVVPLARNKPPVGRLSLQYFPGLYHQVAPEDDELQSLPDTFVLFNPGIGHPKLKEAWRSTLEIILRSGKPALITSFSERDLERDLAALRGMGEVAATAFIIPPHENAFKSRCFQLDPSDVFAPIQTNRFVMGVRGLL